MGNRLLRSVALASIGPTHKPLSDSHPRELALAYLEHNRVTPLHGKTLVSDLFSIHTHAALLDHAQRLRGAGDQL